MKIVMLGHTGVGKTTYMASLYETMQQRVEGFHLKTSKSQDHPRLLDLAQMIRAGSYPSPTSQRDEYEFSLRYQGQDKFTFTWADYRGGALIEKQSSDQANLLVQDLKQADGIMMFCDCDALARGNQKAIQLGRMTSFVGRAVEEAEHPIALAVVLTKADLISKFEDSLLSPFNNLIDIVNASEWVLGAFIPIACGVRPANVPMPLLFTLHATVIVKAVVAASLVEKHYNQAQAWIGKSQGVEGFFRWVGDKWNGNLTDRQMAEYQMAKAIEQYQELESIKEPAEELIKYIQRLPRIDKDKNTNNYIQELSKIHSGIKVSQEYSSLFNQPHIDPFDAFR
jgi:signal recognition particle receptor subunit beta